MKRISFIILALIFAVVSTNAKNDKHLPDWKEGYLDIHHISTGRGSSIFYILPDGTRLLVDAGDLGDPSRWKHKTIAPAVPDESKRPAEWIARYVEHFSKPLNKELYLDYAMISHFDNDHYGYLDHTAITVEGKPYKYSGMTHLANLVPIRTLIDRGYPDYDYPSPEAFRKRNGKGFKNYELFLKEREEQGLKMEKFEVGTDKQLVLKNRAEKYKTFRIMNIAASGVMWSGKGNETRSIIDYDLYPQATPLNENSSSCVFRLEYGKFSYYFGGDICGSYSRKKKNYWNDVQTPISKVIGKMDVAVADHHGFSDSMNKNLLDAMKPQSVIIPVWDYYHPQPATMKRITTDPFRQVYAVGMAPDNRERLAEYGRIIKPEGHSVVRIYKGGKKYQIFVLNDKSLDYEIIYQSEVFSAKGNK